MAWLRFYVIGEFGLNARARCLSFNASFRHYCNAKSSRRSSFVRNSATAATARTRFQVRRRVEEIGQGMQASLSKALGQVGKGAIFAGLSLDAYLALSEAEETALWDRLFKEAEQELTIREHDIPPDFVPARQKRR